MDFLHSSDALLVKSLKEGNENAYRHLMGKYRETLFHYALRFIQDKWLAEEIVMDVMIAVWKRREALDPQLNLSGFLFRCVRNRAIDMMRRRHIDSISLDAVFPHQVSGFRADANVSGRDMEHIFSEGLKLLTPKKRTVFLMSRLHGHSYNSIAHILGLSRNTVENHMVGALRHLRNHLRTFDISR